MKAFLSLAATAAFLTGAAALPAFTQTQTPPPANTQGAGASSSSGSMMACGSMSPNMSQNMSMSSMSHMDGHMGGMPDKSHMPAGGTMDNCPASNMGGMAMMSASSDSASQSASSGSSSSQ
ncbi:hypothetical protein [Asticcacaulis taihuensis]|uniref:hypothetical protein n=1 Tax=Asticcacaulis taihuensis TaxID=260084 RepID=UPI0026EB3F61|nr:hypothetical protein [Asticcacaulis taihuensis]